MLPACVLPEHVPDARGVLAGGGLVAALVGVGKKAATVLPSSTVLLLRGHTLQLFLSLPCAHRSASLEGFGVEVRPSATLRFMHFLPCFPRNLLHASQQKLFFMRPVFHSPHLPSHGFQVAGLLVSIFTGRFSVGTGGGALG